MASITQTIPQYNGGISQQPDEKKLPGQVIEAKNVLPDITKGLLKRPGGKLIGSLSDGVKNSETNGRWFSYYRDEDEQYVGQISRDGTVKIWRCSDGAEMDVQDPYNLSSYLIHTEDEQLQTLTLNDYTYVTNRNQTTAMSATVETVRPPEAFIQLKKVAYASQYSVNLFDTTDTQTVSTVTRIEVERLVSSNNYCTDVGKNMRLHSTRINQIGITGSACDDSCGAGRDGFAPNVGTKIFSISDNVELVDNNLVGGNVSSGSAGGSIVVTNDGQTYDAVPTVVIGTEWAASTSYSVGNQVSKGGNLYTCDTNGTSGSTGPSGTSNNQGDGSTQWDYAGDVATATAVLGGVNGRNVSRIDVTHTGSGYTSTPAVTIVPAAGDSGKNATAEFRDRTTTDYHYKVQVYKSNGDNNNTAKNLYFRLTTTGQSVPDTNNDDVTVYQARYTTTHDLLYGGENWNEGDYFYVWLKDAYYKITVKAVSTGEVQANLGLIRPIPTSFDTKTTVTAESILGAIRSKIISDGPLGNNFTSSRTEIIGNGIYIKRNPNGTISSSDNTVVGTNPFQISTPVNDLLNVFTDSVKDVADLPNQCKHGYVVKVGNSEAEEDDYYVKFIGKLKADGNYLDGEGVWEECPKPGVSTEFNPSTMPIQIVRQADGTFKIEQVPWEKRLVGDEVTVPKPSFIGKAINKMLFFRNRLVMLSDENVIMSQPGEFFNFWPKSAITYTATDNIDLSCSSEYPAIVYDGLQVNSGLVLFTKNQQFMLTTDSDVLSPLTAKINALSSYNFNFKTNPISLGTTIAFLDNAGKHSRFWEMSKVFREGEPDVVDQTKLVSELFDTDITEISNSRENGTVFFSKKDSSTLYGFRYFNASTQRLQQSWFTWETVGTIQYHTILDDALYIVIRNNGKDTLQKYSIKLYSDSITVVNDATYRIHLDSISSVTIADGTYDDEANKTTFPKPNGYENTTAELCLFDNNTTSDFIGKYSKASIVGSNIEVPGNWENKTVILGYLFDMQIKFPTIYVTKVENENMQADTNASLIVHRVKLNFGSYGTYSTTIDRLGKPSYTEIWEAPVADQYLLSNVAIDDEVTKTIPTYERNKNLSITLKSTHPSPATLYSMAWEGDYTSKFYNRV